MGCINHTLYKHFSKTISKVHYRQQDLCTLTWQGLGAFHSQRRLYAFFKYLFVFYKYPWNILKNLFVLKSFALFSKELKVPSLRILYLIIEKSWAMSKNVSFSTVEFLCRKVMLFFKTPCTVGCQAELCSGFLMQEVSW